MQVVLDRLGTDYPWSKFEVALAVISEKFGTSQTVPENIKGIISGTNIGEIELDIGVWQSLLSYIDIDPSHEALDKVSGVVHDSYYRLCGLTGKENAPIVLLASACEDPAGLMALEFPNVQDEIRATWTYSKQLRETDMDVVHTLMAIATPTPIGRMMVVQIEEEATHGHAALPVLKRASMVLSRSTFFVACGAPEHLSAKNRMIMLFSSRDEKCASFWTWRFPAYTYNYSARVFNIPIDDFSDIRACKFHVNDLPLIMEFSNIMKQMLAEEDFKSVDPHVMLPMLMASYEPNRIDAWRSLGFSIDATTATKAASFVKKHPNARFQILSEIATSE
jgi:hypothetical protein